MVGGGGERKTLRIVAKYADACNLYGSVEATKRKHNNTVNKKNLRKKVPSFFVDSLME
jgi:hypothetical protein